MLYAIKKSNKAVKNKRNYKILHNNNNNNNDDKYDYVPTVPDIHSDWS